MTKSSRHARLNSTFSRNRVQRNPLETILVVCGGVKTEPKYFESVRRHYKVPTLQIDVYSEGKDPSWLVRYAINLRDIRARAAKKSLRRGEIGLPPYDDV